MLTRNAPHLLSLRIVPLFFHNRLSSKGAASRRVRYLVVPAGYDEKLLSSRLNAPTTLPPVLVVPLRKEESFSAVRHYMTVGKSYLNFYKAAAKQIWSNRKTAKLIRARFPDHPLLNDIPGNALDHKTGQLIRNVESSAGAHVELSRAEFQLVRRLSQDMKKVPIFVLLLAVFGEWLPLFVVFLDPLLPRSVLLPAQVLKRRRKAAMSLDHQNTNSGNSIRHDLEGSGIHDRAQLVKIARRFGLLGPISQYYQVTTLLKGIRQHAKYLNVDDELIRKNTLHAPGGAGEAESLSDIELELALEERGLWQENQTTDDRRLLLRRWLNPNNKGHTCEDDDETTRK